MENMVNFSEVMDFYKGKKVLLTGHTGFKGTWLWTILEQAGADLWGYALAPQEKTSLHSLCGYANNPEQSYETISDIEKW